VSKFDLPETQFERTVRDKIVCKSQVSLYMPQLEKYSLKEQRVKLPVKLTWSEKMTVLSTFLESSLNSLSNNLKTL